MAIGSGFSNQKKIGPSQYLTVHNVGSDKYAENVVTKGLIERQLTSIAITAVELVVESKENLPKIYLEVIGHGCTLPGEVLRFYTGGLATSELDIVEIIDADTLVIYNVLPVLPQVGDEVRTAYYRTPQFDLNGNIVVSAGPNQFILDGVNTPVEQNTTFPPDNRPMPSGMFILKEGISYPVSDSNTPSEVVAVPVKIMAVDGTNISITAGDINVQTTDIGPNFDSMRIGDGSGNYIGVNASTEALVHDQDVLDELTTLNAKDLATEAKQDDILTALGLLSTATKQDAQTTLLGEIRTEEIGIHSDTTAINGKLNSLGQKTMAGSVPVVLPSDQTISATIDTTGLATEAKQDATITALGLLATSAKQDTIIANQEDQITEAQTLNAKDFSTEATLQEVKDRLGEMAAGLTPAAFDSISIAYVSGTTDIQTVSYFTGGLSGTLVSTLTLGYDGDANLTSVERT